MGSLSKQHLVRSQRTAPQHLHSVHSPALLHRPPSPCWPDCAPPPTPVVHACAASPCAQTWPQKGAALQGPLPLQQCVHGRHRRLLLRPAGERGAGHQLRGLERKQRQRHRLDCWPASLEPCVCHPQLQGGGCGARQQLGALLWGVWCGQHRGCCRPVDRRQHAAAAAAVCRTWPP